LTRQHLTRSGQSLSPLDFGRLLLDSKAIFEDQLETVEHTSVDKGYDHITSKLQAPDLEVIPISALQGDNVVTRSERMPWYEESSLLHHLETVYVASDRDLVDVRFPVQYVIRPKSDAFHDYRGHAGQVPGGVLKTGDEVMVLSRGQATAGESPKLYQERRGERFT